MTTDIRNIPIQLTRRGNVSRAASTYAAGKIEHLLHRTQDPVQQVHLTLDATVPRAHRHPARIEIGTVVDGRPIRVDVTAPTLFEAADQAVDVLRRRLRQLRDRPLSRRHRLIRAAADEERRQATRREWLADADLASRPVVKRKAFTLLPMTTEEAAAEMELLDHDFYLYVDSATGRASVVYPSPGGGYGVSGGAGSGVPALTAGQAKERLALSGDRFLFFHDPDAGQDQVLYRRYDGALGLITAA